ACLGAAADTETLAIVLETSLDQVHASLSDAVRQELVERRGDSYYFIHDRVQEAAYSMIPQTSRAEVHLRIGRLLTERTPKELQEEAIFEIVSQFNQGAALIASKEERAQVAQLNLVAGKRAKASAAYASALSYLKAGMELLSQEAWENRQGLAFELEQHRADCELWMGAFSSAEERLAALASRAADTVQRAVVASRRVDLYTMLRNSNRAVELGLEYLRSVGIDWPPHPSEMEAQREYQRIWSNLGDREIEELINLSRMADSEQLATLDFLAMFGAPTLYFDENLYTLAICRGVNLSLDHGNSDASTAIYAAVGLSASYHFSDYAAGYRLGRLACDLVEQRGMRRFAAKTYVVFALLTPWTRPLGESLEAGRRGFQVASELGDAAYAARALSTVTFRRLAVGEPLDRVAREAEDAMEFSRKLGFEHIANLVFPTLAITRMLRGETVKFGSFDQGNLSERAFEERMTRLRAVVPECFYWIRKLQAGLSAGDYTAAIDAAEKAERGVTSGLLKIHPLELAEYHLYTALSHAACCEPTGLDPYATHQAKLAAHHAQIKSWEANCPANFEHAVALVGAEIARIEGRVLDAES
ncbi:MAG: histidine kinase, partial [Bradyrhizobium sp.]